MLYDSKIWVVKKNDSFRTEFRFLGYVNGVRLLDKQIGNRTH
jgi:hypothetical protein